MTENEILAVLEKHGPMKRADLHQWVVSKYEIQKKPVPPIDKLLAQLQKMLDTNKIYIKNHPGEKDLSKFPLNVSPAIIDLASRRVR